MEALHPPDWGPDTEIANGVIMEGGVRLWVIANGLEIYP